MTEYENLTDREKEYIKEFVRPKFCLVNEKGEIRETSRNKPTLVGMKHYFEKMHIEKLQVKNLDKDGKVREYSNHKPISSSQWLR